MRSLQKLLIGALSLALLIGAVGCTGTPAGGGQGGGQEQGGSQNQGGGQEQGGNENQGSGQGQGEQPENTPLEDNSGMIYDKYDLKTYLYPYWEGNTVYNETLWFADERSAPLMYQPEEVLKVTSYDLNTVYEENVDYTVDGKNIVLTENSRIPYMPRDTYLTPTTNGPANGGIPAPLRDSSNRQIGYLWACEGPDISSRQVVVTYRHSERGNWVKPTVQTDKISRTIAKLEAGEEVKLVFYGDSITVGANASGFLQYGPKAESYADMVKSYIAARYPSATVNCVNNAVGGTDSNWANDRLTGNATFDAMDGGKHFETRVANQEPDLLFIAFGMNDSSYGPQMFEQNINSVVERAQAADPDVEIVLISGMIAHPGTPFNNKNYKLYEESLATIASKHEHVALARVWTTVNTIYETLGKRFQDCTANNVNHPNDFMMRVYSQTILQTLFGEGYIKAI